MTRAILYTSAILAAGGIALLLAARWLRPRWTAWAAMAIGLASPIPLLLPGGPGTIVLWEWLPGNGWATAVTLHFDTLSATMAMLAAGPALLLLLWMSLGAAQEEGSWAPFLLLLPAVFLLIVSSANLLLAFAGWEALLLITYFLLVYRRGALPTPGIAEWFLGSQHLAGYPLLFALVGIGQAAGTWDHTLLEAGAVAPLAMALLLLSAWVRMALVPFQIWAMGVAESPGPVSTLLLGSWSLLPGFYFWLRLLPLTAAQAPREFALIVGTAGLLLGAVLALRQESSRRVQAGDTVARLGLVWIALGLSGPLGIAAGLLLLLDLLLSKVAFHLALTKGLDRPLRQGLFLVGAWQSLGLPPSFGFVGRWLLVLGLFQAGRAFYLPFLLLAAPLTLAYLWRGWTLVPEGAPAPSRAEGAVQRVIAALVGLLPLGSLAAPWIGPLSGQANAWLPALPALAADASVSTALGPLAPWLPAWGLLFLIIGGLGAWWSGALAALGASPGRAAPPVPQEGAAGVEEGAAAPAAPGHGPLQEPLPVLSQETGWLAWVSRPTSLFGLLGRLAGLLAVALHSLVNFLERHTTYFLLVVLVAAAVVLIVLTR